MKHMRSRLYQVGLVFGLPLALLLASCTVTTSTTPAAGTTPLGSSSDNHAAGTTTDANRNTSTTSATLTTRLNTSGSHIARGITSDANGNTTLVGFGDSSVPGDANAGAYGIILVKHDPKGNQLWATQFGSGRPDSGIAITTDINGNTILIGDTVEALPGYRNAGSSDIIVAKYDSDGNQLWERQLGTFRHDNSRGITTDANGNITVAGDTQAAFPGHTNAGSTDIILIKYDPDGNQLWTTQFGTSKHDSARGITTDANGNTTLVGETEGALPGHTNAGNTDIILAKYDPHGNQLWATQFGTSGIDRARGITIDANGNTTLVGHTEGALRGHTYTGYYSDFFLAKYDPDGNQLWTAQFGTSSRDEAAGITIDAQGNTIITGYTWGELPDFTNAGQYDFILVKYDPNGNQLWATQFGSSGRDYAWAITTDANGNTTVVGDTNGALPGHTNVGGRDIILAKYDRNGRQLWTR